MADPLPYDYAARLAAMRERVQQLSTEHTRGFDTVSKHAPPCIARDPDPDDPHRPGRAVRPAARDTGPLRTPHPPLSLPSLHGSEHRLHADLPQRYQGSVDAADVGRTDPARSVTPMTEPQGWILLVEVGVIALAYLAGLIRRP